MTSSAGSPISVLARELKGSVLIEFAFGAALVLMLLLGTVELARFIIVQQKLERVAMTVADLNARGEELTRADVQAVFQAVPHIMAPFELLNGGAVIVSSVGDPGTGRTSVLWQERSGSGDAASKVGLQGRPATMPPEFVVGRGETAIIVEAFFDYDALFLAPLLPSNRLYAQAVRRPRLMDTTVLR